eukprot:364684-Chlamydomonas_euryale.AAC.9
MSDAIPLLPFFQSPARLLEPTSRVIVLPVSVLTKICARSGRSRQEVVIPLEVFRRPASAGPRGRNSRAEHSCEHRTSRCLRTCILKDALNELSAREAAAGTEAVTATRRTSALLHKVESCLLQPPS